MNSKILIVALCLVMAGQNLCEAGFLDRILDMQGNGESKQSGVQTSGRDVNVNIPTIYDMVKSGSSLGINVLSGLVKVERGDEAERSGLVGTRGRRPLSVSVFGIPVYERGVRVSNRPPTSSGGGTFIDDRRNEDAEPKVEDSPNEKPEINDP